MVPPFLEAISIGMSLTALFFCVYLLRRYGGTVEKLPGRPVSKWQPQEWIAAGIFVGFTGELLDGAYWSLVWVAIFYDLPAADPMAAWGTVANIPFRWGMTSVAAYCHIRAALAVDPDFRERRFTRLMVAAALAGLVVSVALMVVGR